MDSARYFNTTWCLTQRTYEVTAITSQHQLCDVMEYAVAVKARAGTFRPELVKSQTEADVVSKYICGFFPGSISLLARSLDALCIDRASIAAEYRCFL
ncbi:hypothetical protein WJX77_010767 [Trebouxia sp. C0004]